MAQLNREQLQFCFDELLGELGWGDEIEETGVDPLNWARDKIKSLHKQIKRLRGSLELRNAAEQGIFMIDIQKVIEFVENVYDENNQTLATQELVKMGLAENDILLSKTTRPLFFCSTHQLENFIKQGYRANEASHELECRRTPRAADGDDCEHELDTSETGLFCIKCGECF